MKLFHFHAFKPTAVNHITCRTRRAIGGVVISGEPVREWPATTVLMRCECGEFKTLELEGVWELSDLTGPKGDRDFLKSAGVKL